MTRRDGSGRLLRSFRPFVFYFVPFMMRSIPPTQFVANLCLGKNSFLTDPGASLEAFCIGLIITSARQNVSLRASFLTPGGIQFRFKVHLFLLNFSEKKTEMNRSLPIVDMTPATPRSRRKGGVLLTDPSLFWVRAFTQAARPLHLAN
jgi:hypothetical protein